VNAREGITGHARTGRPIRKNLNSRNTVGGAGVTPFIRR